MTDSRETRASRSPAFIGEEPRLLMLAFLTILVLTFFVGRMSGLVVVLFYLVSLIALARPGRLWVAWPLRSILLFVVIIVFVNAIFVEGRPLPGILAFMSWEGLQDGVFFSLRVIVLLLAFTLFVDMVRPESLAAAVAALLRPIAPSLARRVALYAFLSIGFLPLFADEVSRIDAAQRFRGGGVAGSLRQRIRGVRSLVVPLIISAVRRASQLATIVHVRGIEERIENVTALGRPSRKDVFFATATIAVMVVAVMI